MKNILPAAILLLASIDSAAQKSETLERLAAKPFPISKRLIVSYLSAPKIIKYAEDSPSVINGQLPKYFSYKETDVEFEVELMFINPLQYRVALTSKQSDDPNEKVISDYFDGLKNMQPSATTADVTAKARIRTANGTEAPASSSNLLPEWVFQLRTTQAGQTGYPTDYHKQIASAFDEIEKYLNGTFNVSATGTQTYEQHIINSVNKIKTASTAADFTLAVSDANSVLKELSNVSSVVLKSNLDNLINKMRTPTGFSYTAPFIDYTDYSIVKLKLLYETITAAQNKLLSSFKSLLENVNKVKINGDRILLTAETLKFQDKKDLTITFIVTTISVDSETLLVSEKEKFESQVTVIRKRAQVEVSAGLALFSKSITYNSYSIDADSINSTNGADAKLVNRIGNTQSTRWLIPTLFLNFYRRAGEGNLWILPQVGVGTGKELPTFLVGSGYVIPNKWIISLGLANAFNQELKNTYKENDVVDASLKASDLYETRWVPRLYLSVQFKF